MPDFLFDSLQDEPAESASQIYSQTPATATEAAEGTFYHLWPQAAVRSAARGIAGSDNPSLWEQALSDQMAGGLGPDITAQPSQMISADDTKKYSADGKPLSDVPIREDLARELGSQQADKMQADSAIQRFNQAHSWPVNVGLSMAVSLADPAQDAAMFIPGIGEEAIAAKLGLGTGLGGRVAALGIGGAAAGATVQAPVSALQLAFDPDYHLKDALYDTFFQAPLMAATGAVGLGLLGEAFKSTARAIGFQSATERHAAMSTAVAQTLHGQEIDVEHTFTALPPEQQAQTAVGRLMDNPLVGASPQGGDGARAALSAFAQRQKSLRETGWAPGISQPELEAASQKVASVDPEPEPKLAEAPPLEEWRAAVEAQPRLTLQPVSSEELIARGEAPLGAKEEYHDILDANGQRAGFVVSSKKGDTTDIHMIAKGTPEDVYGDDSLGGGANAFGPAELRGLLRQYKQQNPEIKNLTGLRVSGARRESGGAPKLTVALPETEKAPEHATPASKPNGAVSFWVREAIDRDFQQAQKAGVVDDIERLSAEGKTAFQVAKQLQSRLPEINKADPLAANDHVQIVRSVRSVLDIPRMDDSAEFLAWQKAYHARQKASAPTPQAEPAGRKESTPQPIVEAPAPTEQPTQNVVGFETSKGSQYELHEDGTTTRNKSYHPEHGPQDVGLKPRSARTIYVDKDSATTLSGAGLSGVGPKGFRLILKDGKASLLSWNEAAGRWGVSPSSRDIPFTTKPEIGKAPVEAWSPKDDVPGYGEAYSNQHAGNEITKLVHEGAAPEVAKASAPRIEADWRTEMDRLMGEPVTPETGEPVRAPGATLYTKLPKQPQRLVDWIRKNGGLNDEGGDVRHIMGGAKARPGLISKKGMALDDATLKAWEDGYLPEHGERPTTQALLDALDDDLRGTNPRYSEIDSDAVEEYRKALQHNQEIDRLSQELGIEPKGLTHAQFFDAVADRMSFEDMAQRVADMADEREELHDALTEYEPPRSLDDLEREEREEQAAGAMAEGTGPAERPNGAGGGKGAGEAAEGPGGGGVGDEGGNGPEDPKLPESNPERAAELDDAEQWLATREPGDLSAEEWAELEQTSEDMEQADMKANSYMEAASCLIEAAGAAPVTEMTEQGEQLVMPGAERSARQMAAARDAAGRGRMTSTKPQASPGGMFEPKPAVDPSLF